MRRQTLLSVVLSRCTFCPRHAVASVDSLLLVVLAFVLGSCSLINAIDVCDRATPTEHQANIRNEGSQRIDSPYAIAIFPNVGPFLAYTSDASGQELEKNREVHGIFLDWTGEPQSTCGFENGIVASLAEPELGFASIAAPITENNSALIAFTTGRDDLTDSIGSLQIAFTSSTGCKNHDITFAPIEESSDILSPPIPIALDNPGSTDRFLLLWSSYRTQREIRAVVLDYLAPAEPRRAGTDLDPTGAIVSLDPLSGSPSGLAAISVRSQGEEQLIATLWNEIELATVYPVFTIYNDRLSTIVESVRLSPDGSSNASSHVAELGLALAFDGQQILTIWTEFTPGSPGRIWGRFLDISGQALRADPWSPDGEPFRIGSSQIATETSPAAAAMRGGGFMVIWEESGDTSRQGGATHLRGRLIDPLGSPNFSNPACARRDFPIGLDPPNTDSRPVIEVSEDGSVLVAWNSTTDRGRDFSGTGIRSMVWALEDLLPMEE